MLQVWVLLRFIAFVPLLYHYVSTMRTTFHRCVTVTVGTWASAVFCLAFYLIVKVLTPPHHQPGEAQIMIIQMFFLLVSFISAAPFAETFQPNEAYLSLYDGPSRTGVVTETAGRFSDHPIISL